MSNRNLTLKPKDVKHITERLRNSGMSVEQLAIVFDMDQSDIKARYYCDTVCADPEFVFKFDHIFDEHIEYSENSSVDIAEYAETWLSAYYSLPSKGRGRIIENVGLTTSRLSKLKKGQRKLEIATIKKLDLALHTNVWRDITDGWKSQVKKDLNTESHDEKATNIVVYSQKEHNLSGVFVTNLLRLSVVCPQTIAEDAGFASDFLTRSEDKRDPLTLYQAVKLAKVADVSLDECIIDKELERKIEKQKKVIQDAKEMYEEELNKLNELMKGEV